MLSLRQQGNSRRQRDLPAKSACLRSTALTVRVRLKPPCYRPDTIDITAAVVAKRGEISVFDDDQPFSTADFESSQS